MFHKIFYGNFSMGSGSRLRNPSDIFKKIEDKNVIKEYKNSIVRDLQKSKIKIKDIAKWKIMDVGLGRQAIAFLNITKNTVDHYDINRTNVKKIQSLIKRNKVSQRLSTNCKDLVHAKLPVKKYDLLYLQGIVQHFSDPSKGLKNCLNAVKQGGIAWIYFYRSGSFNQFVDFILRDFIHNSEISNLTEKNLIQYVKKIKLFSKKKKIDYYFADCFIDSVFTKYAWLYRPDVILKSMQKSGYKKIFSSGVKPEGVDYEHSFLRGAFVYVFKKCKHQKLFLNNLKPHKSINQLKIKYQSSQIKKTIYIYKNFKKKLNTMSKINKILLSLCVYKKIEKFIKINKTNFNYKHKVLQKILKESLNQHAAK